MGCLRWYCTAFQKFQFCSLSPVTNIMKYLNVAEKNDAAKNIASILSRGASNRREDLSPYNKIYEFEAQVFGQNCKMVMTSVSGHLLNYEFTSAYKNWQGCNPLVLFDAPIVKGCSKDYERIKKTLEREIRSCQGLIIWTDCDREGENIGFEIIKVCTDVKPDVRIYRAKFSEITGPSIFRALNTLGQPNKNVSDAVDVRQELDLRTGAALTRLQTLRLQKVFPQKLSNKLISYGSCQFPTLGFVVERYQSIENFIPEPFWKIEMKHTVENLTTDFSWKRCRLFDKNACQAILDHCKENPQAKVDSVESKPKSRWRPLPLDTVEMEKIISKKLRINAKETMKIAEKLYTQGFISYPRTETNIFPKELNLTTLVEQQNNDPRWGPFAHRIMNEGGPTPRQGKKSDQAHPPIHPTKYTNSLNGNEQKVYEYIVRHFLACVYKDAQGFETTVIVEIAGEKFTAKGLIILEKNYLDVYIYDKWNAKEINNYQQGSTFTPTVLDMTESSTTAPKLLTESDLIALMEKHGIGTDATHAEHIDTIKSREYVGMVDNIYFVPGTLGMGLVEGYNNIGLEISLAKPTLRADFENDLKMVCDGLKSAETVRREQIEKYKSVFQTVAVNMQLIDTTLANRLEDNPQQVQDPVFNGGIDNNLRPALKCPKCGNDMTIRSKKNGTGKFISCVGYPACKNAIWFPDLVENVEIMNDSCPQCGPDFKMLKMKFRPNPFPGEPNPNVICIGGCDMNVLDTLNINRASVRREEIRPAVQRNEQTTVNRPANQSNSSNRPQNNLNSWLNIPQNNHTNSSDSGFHSQNLSRTVAPNQSFQNANVSRNNTWLSGDAANISKNTNRNSLDNVPGPSGMNRTNNSMGNVSRHDDIVCQCNQEARQFTVRKDGPNKGRQFYKCASDACNFFLWAADGEPAETSSTTRDDELKCNCRVPAVTRTVSKDGPNKGRQFYCCPKPRGDGGCGFFKWTDETNNGWSGGGDDGSGGGGGANLNYSFRAKAPKGRGKKTNARAAPYGNQPKGKRKCGRCGQEGHTKNRCPN